MLNDYVMYGHVHEVSEIPIGEDHQTYEQAINAKNSSDWLRVIESL